MRKGKEREREKEGEREGGRGMEREKSLLDCQWDNGVHY